VLINISIGDYILRISSRYVGFIAILVLVILISGCLNNSDDSGNFSMLNRTDNGTYSVAGVSFKCPDNWFVSTDNVNGNIDIMASPIHALNTSEIKSFGPFKVGGFGTVLTFDDPQFEVHIIPNSGNSVREAINRVKNDYMASGNKISNSKIMVGGNEAFKDIIVSNDVNDEYMRFEYIYFVKNNETYLITFSARDKDFDKEKANFDMILNSFKVH